MGSFMANTDADIKNKENIFFFFISVSSILFDGVIITNQVEKHMSLLLIYINWYLREIRVITDEMLSSYLLSFRIGEMSYCFKKLEADWETLSHLLPSYYCYYYSPVWDEPWFKNNVNQQHDLHWTQHFFLSFFFIP